MTFAGRGLSVITGLLSEWARILPVLALLLLCAHSWGACTTQNITAGYSSFGPGSYSVNSSLNCVSGSVECGSYDCKVWANWSSPASFSYTASCTGSGGSYLASCNNVQGNCYYMGENVANLSATALLCDTQAEADSAYCALNPTAEGCVEEDVPPSCQADYQQCVGLGGVWQKISSSNTECVSLCNTCESSAGVNFRNTQIDICCQQGLAPPDSAVQCSFPAERGPGMTWSTRLTKAYDEGYSCGQLSTASGEAIQENQALFKRFCLDGDRYEEQSDTNDVGGGSSSSGGEGMSSSEDIGHSFGTELEALGGLYGVLDTIRDTLTKRLTPATEDIRDCLYNFKLCTALEPLQIDWTGMPQDTSMLQIDTAILKHIKPMMDSSVKLDSAQLKVLKQLDSLYKRGLVNDTDMVQAVNAIKGDIDDVESAVKGVKHGIDSLIDSMTTYMDKVGQGLAAVGDSVGALRGVVEGLFDTTGIGAAMSAAGSSVDTAGWGAFSDTLSGRYGKLITKASGGAWGDSASLETVFGPTSADSVCNDDSCLDAEADSALRYQQDSAVAMLQRARDSLVADTDMLAAYYDTLSREMQIFNFDSLLLAPLREAIPTQNNCPEDCFKGSFKLELIGNAMIPYDYKLCERWSFLGGVDVFVIIRVILRLITALSCVFIGIWYITGRKI